MSPQLSGSFKKHSASSVCILRYVVCLDLFTSSFTLSTSCFSLNLGATKVRVLLKLYSRVLSSDASLSSCKLNIVYIFDRICSFVPCWPSSVLMAVITIYLRVIFCPSCTWLLRLSYIKLRLHELNEEELLFKLGVGLKACISSDIVISWSYFKLF